MAVIISQQKVQPLPAADPFKFSLDKLQGKRRRLLLTEDFESYDLGFKERDFGQWNVQSGTRKGQGVCVEDPAERIAAANAEVDVAIQLPPPPKLIGARAANIAAAVPNPTNTYPVLAREIDAKQFPQYGQVLIEFDIFPRGGKIQPSLALAGDVGHTAGIELWRDVDATKQVEYAPYRWYRLRVLLDVMDSSVRQARVERSQWRGSEGWVRDLTFQPPVPKLDLSAPRYAIFGFPAVTPSTSASVFWLDNIRMEVIAEK